MTRIIVDPGVCGFKSEVIVLKISKRNVLINIISDCEKIKSMANSIKEIDSFEIFKPILECKVYLEANNAKVHTNCVLPPGIIKAIEVEAGFALPRDASIQFQLKVE